MANNRLTWDGIEAFKSALRQLPSHLSGRGGDIVVARAHEAGEEVRQGYALHEHTGNLEQHVVVEVESRAAGAVAIVKSTARHAYIFEIGTQIRKTKSGANRGAMPPGNVFVPTVVRKRRAMVEDLKALMTESGLEVSGG